MLEQGSVVRSIAGHDKNRFYCVIKLKGSEGAFIADGKRRKQEAPKYKNRIHLAGTNTVLQMEEVATNKKLRAALTPFNQHLNSTDK